MADDTNEFAVDTPEAYQQDQILNPAPEVAAPEADDIDDEPAATDTPAAPVQAAAPTPVAAPAASAVAFDQKNAIPGLVENNDLSLEGIALATKEKLSKEPKVTMMIPLDPGEKAGAYRTVQINGYRFDVRKNTMVALPQSVAQLLMDAYRITNDVLENNPLNLSRADEEKRRALGV